jgi:hypothetical protein
MAKTAHPKQRLSEIADGFVEYSFAGKKPQPDEANAIIQDLLKRQHRLIDMQFSLMKVHLVLFALLALTTLHSPAPTDGINILGTISITRDVVLRFREVFLVLSTGLGAAALMMSYVDEQLEALKIALIKHSVPERMVNLTRARYATTAQDDGVMLLALTRPHGRESLSPIFAIGFGIAALIFSSIVIVAGIHVWVLYDIIAHPAEPRWISYAAVGLVLLADASALYWYVARRFRRRVMYSDKLRRAIEEWRNGST